VPRTPRPTPDRVSPGDAREAVAERRSRSLEEPLDVRRRAEAPYPLLEVRNPLHGTVYVAMLPEFPARTSELCTCVDFARRGLGTCKHLEAAFRWMTDHPGPSGSPPDVAGVAGRVWREVDRRVGAPRSGPAFRAVRRAGAALFESGLPEPVL